jgi:hypothetical protein
MLSVIVPVKVCGFACAVVSIGNASIATNAIAAMP